jgi:hypothetical protein
MWYMYIHNMYLPIHINPHYICVPRHVLAVAIFILSKSVTVSNQFFALYREYFVLHSYSMMYVIINIIYNVYCNT